MSKILQNPSKTLLQKKLLSSLITARPMGGGPRTFPGGLNKWEWRRLHEKKARDKEHRLLDQEKQLYQARLRGQLRASRLGSDPQGSDPSHAPLSPKEHIKALADRFVKAGAEDLWNEDDGPISRPVEKGQPGPMNCGGNFQQKRGYCSGNFSNLINFRVSPGNLSDLANVRVFRSNLELMRDDYSGYSSDLAKVGVFRSNFEQKTDNYSGYSSDLANVRVLRGNLLHNMGIYSGSSSGLGNVRVLRGNLLHKRGIYSGNSSDFGNFGVLGCNLEHRRGYSSKVMVKPNLKLKLSPKGGKSKSPKKRSGYSSNDDDEDYGPIPENARWPKFKIEPNVKEMREEERGRRGARGFLGTGVLGKYDVKITKRSIMKELEYEAKREAKGVGLSEKVEAIKKEFLQRKMGENAIAVNDGVQRGGDELVDELVPTGKRFDQSGISPLTVQALTDAGYFTMSKLQKEVLSVCLDGKDVLVNARPGMGKTASFLLPAIETVIKAMSNDKVQRVPPIYVLVLCPIRELASQIAAEARVLLKYHDGIGVQALVGSARFKDDLKRIESEPCQIDANHAILYPIFIGSVGNNLVVILNKGKAAYIGLPLSPTPPLVGGSLLRHWGDIGVVILVATPGRLLDHIESRSGLSVRLMGLKMLVLDEADRMIDLGFRTDIERVIDCLPRRRQAMVFSETVPIEVRRISQILVNRDHACVNAFRAGSPEPSLEAKQSYYVAPHNMHFQVVYHLLKEHIAKMLDYKIIVFCNTGVVASLMGQLFREMKLHSKDLHPRKTEAFRTRMTNDFKMAKRGILVSSDVPRANAKDYPDVTLVVQVGIPSNREQYIDRIRKSGRDRNYAEGILVLAPWEEFFYDEIKDLNIERLSTPLINKKLKLKMDEAMTKVDSSVKESAYNDWLTHYNSHREIGRDKTSLVERANEFSESIGFEKPPRMVRKSLLKMGLAGIPGIRMRYR